MSPLLTLLLLLFLAKSFGRIGEIGYECDLDSDRIPCLVPNSFCVKGICVCAPLYQHIGDECVLRDKSSSFGKACNTSYACKGEGEYCSSYGRCMCLTTHIDINGKCKPAVYPGQSGCEDSRQCAKGYPGAICDSHQKCRCPNGLEAQLQTCIFVAKHPTETTNSTFFEDFAKLLAEGSKRRFVPLSHRRRSATYHPHYYDLYRKQYSPNHLVTTGVPPDGLCFSDRDCAGYPSAYCDGVCRCSEGALNSGTACIPSSHKFGSTGSCPMGHVYVQEAGACMTIQKPGEPCQYSQQCSGAEPGAFCSRLRCECVYGMKSDEGGCIFSDRNCTKRGYIWIPELGECKEVISPGSSGCSHSSQCSSAYNNTFCYNQTCTCPGDLVPIDGTCGKRCSDGQVYSGITGQCLPTVQPGDDCLYSSQCHGVHPGLVCDRSKCRCPNRQVFTGTVCSDVCPQGYIVGQDGICKIGCTANQVEVNGECYDKVAAGQRCSLSLQCLGGSSCVNSICKCPSSMEVKLGVCKKKQVEPLKSCAFDEICTGGSFCSNGSCVCPLGTSVVNDQCIKPITVTPNSPCNPSVRCGGGSQCVTNVCQCPTNQKAVNGTCRKPPAVPIGGSCLSNSDKCKGSSVCLNGICECPFGTVSENGECKPLRRSPVGGPCSASLLCLKPAACIAKKCQCPIGTYLKNGNCRPMATASAGSTCSNGERCMGGSYCKNKVCTCPPNAEVIGGVCQSIKLGNPGESCDVDEDCMGGALCTEKKCTCPIGTVAAAGVCISAFGNLGSCTDSKQCTGGSYCDKHQHLCVCPENQIIIRKRCVASIKARKTVPSTSSYCADDSTCTGGSHCVNKRCRCPNGEILYTGTCTVVSAMAGESCMNGEQCIGGSYCLHGICVCPPKMIAESGQCIENRVLTNVGLGEPCTQLFAQCNHGTICLNGLCSCMPGTILDNDRCKKRITANPGEQCGDDVACIGGSFCNEMNNTCICSPGTIKIGRNCLQTFRSPPGFPCGSGEECIGGSFCIENTCVCQKHQLRENRRCVSIMKADPFEDCDRGQLCTGGSKCDFGSRICKCLPDYDVVVVDSRKVCKAVIPSGPGDSCLKRNERCINNSYCIDGSCQCISGTSVFNKKCISITFAVPGEECQNGEQCLGGSSCKNGTCVCPEDHVIVSKECKKLMSDVTTPRPVQKPCVASNQCAFGAECINNFCQCSPGTKMSRVGFCVPITTGRREKRDDAVVHAYETFNVNSPGLGDECDAKQYKTCKGNGICVDGICTCSLSDVQNGSECINRQKVSIQIREPNDPCTEGQLCIGGTTCLENVCTCPVGTILADDSCITVYAEIGEDCSNGESCRGNALCLDNICTCTGDTEVKDGKCYLKRPRAKSPGISCFFDPTICQSGTYCLNGVCVCPIGNEGLDGACLTINPGFQQNVGGVFNIPNFNGVPIVGGLNNIMVPNPLSSLLNPNLNYNYQANLIGLPIADGVLPIVGGAGINQGLLNQLGPIAGGNPSLLAALLGLNPGLLGAVQLVSPGMPCQISDPTVQCGGNSICANGFCSCPGGEQIVNGICESRDTEASPGEACQLGITRCTGGSLCIFGICTCPINHAALDGICTPVLKAEVLPNDPCTTGSVCVGQSSCVDGICTCAPGYFAAPGAPACAPVQQPMSMFYLNSDVMVKQPSVRSIISAPGQRCRNIGTTSPCSGDAICVNEVCICPPNRVISNGQCVPFLGEVPAGDSCSVSGTVCGGGSSCVNGICTCTIGSIPQNGQCLPTLTVSINTLPILEPGSPCTMLCNDCPQCGGGSICVDNICKCPLGQFAFRSQCVKMVPQLPSVRKSKIPLPSPQSVPTNQAADSSIKLVRPGDSCNTYAVCGGGSSCIIGKCVCPPGYVPNANRDSCMNSLLKPGGTVVGVDPGDDCTLSTVCGGGATCEQQICACPSNMYPLNNVCTTRTVSKQLYPGSPCASIDICLLNSQCIRGFCVCAAGFETNGKGYCIEASSSDVTKGLAGSQCSSSNFPCKSSLQCSRWGRCICSGNAEGNGLGDCTFTTQVYAPQSMSSLKRRCNSSADCGETIACSNGICKCEEGFIFRKERCILEKKELSLAQSTCKNSSDCKSGLICINKKCSCPQGMFESALGSCIYKQNTVPPGSWCNEDSGVLCNGGSKCYRNSCVCPYGHVINALECTPAPSVNPGGSCMNGEICVGGSLCREGKCTCPSGSTVEGQPCPNRFSRSVTSLIGKNAANNTEDPTNLRLVKPCPADDSCSLPKCYCSRTEHDIPGRLDSKDVPQMVIFTFEGPLSDEAAEIIKLLFNGRFRNPNGCPITATFFVSHEGNNYDHLQWLANHGSEIAVNSFTADDLSNESTDRWHKEMSSMRSVLERFSLLSPMNIVGFRAPHLKLGGNRQFDAAKKLQFLYDSSLTSTGGAFWPQTLEYQPPWECLHNECLNSSYPRIWEMPITDLLVNESSSGRITFEEALRNFNSSDALSTLLYQNLYHNYMQNRAPLVIAIETDLLLQFVNTAVPALESFIINALNSSDVYMVSAVQSIKWIQQPTDLLRIHNFKPWKCPMEYNPLNFLCKNPSTCSFVCEHGEPHSFRVCGKCPRSYPNLDNLFGDS